MAGVYIIFQYVDSLVNRTSPIYFPCYCFDLFLIMRLFLHVPRLLKKKIWMLKVRVLQLLYLVYLANSCCITAFSVSIKCNCLSAKLKKGARKPVIVRSRNHWRFFFCEYLLLLHSNQGRDCKKKSFNTNVPLTRKSSKDVQATSVTLVHRLGTIFQPGLNEDNKNLKNLLDKNT